MAAAAELLTAGCYSEELGSCTEHYGSDPGVIKKYEGRCPGAQRVTKCPEEKVIARCTGLKQDGTVPMAVVTYSSGNADKDREAVQLAELVCHSQKNTRFHPAL